MQQQQPFEVEQQLLTFACNLVRVYRIRNMSLCSDDRHSSKFHFNKTNMSGVNEVKSNLNFLSKVSLGRHL